MKALAATAPAAGGDASLAQEEGFRLQVRDYCERELPPHVRAKVRAGLFLTKQDNLDFLRSLARRGWVAGHWPREYGGAGWTPVQRFIFEEESTLRGAPWLVPFGINYVGPVIYTFGTDAQKQRFLPPILDSRVWWAQGYSEPGAGSDLAGIRTRAIRRGDHYVVSGQKTWTSYVQWADWIFCLVRTSEEARRQQGISFLLIDMKTPGITVRPIATMDGCHHVNEVFFDDVPVPVANRVGEEGKGWSYAKFLLNNERILAAETGHSMRALSDLKARVAAAPDETGPRRAEFERRVARLSLKLHALRAFCLACARHMAAAESPGVEASVMKIRGSELLQEITEATLQWLGRGAIVYDVARVHAATPAPAAGAAHASGAVREYLHARAATIYGGSNEIQRNIIARAELGL